jgi:hypothetical protein
MKGGGAVSDGICDTKQDWAEHRGVLDLYLAAQGDGHIQARISEKQRPLYGKHEQHARRRRESAAGHEPRTTRSGRMGAAVWPLERT